MSELTDIGRGIIVGGDGRVYDKYDVVESLMRGPAKIVYNGIAIYANEAIQPDEIWVVNGNWRDMHLVRQTLHVSRAMWEGLMRHQRDVAMRTGLRGVQRALVSPDAEWAMRVMVIETDPQYSAIWPTMQRTIDRLAEHSRAGL